MKEKPALRKKYKSIRDAIGEDRAEYSKKICENCAKLSEFLVADTVLLYFAKGSEADLSTLARIAWGMGKTVGYPRCREDGTIVFHKVSDFSELCQGHFGLMEPHGDSPLCDTEKAALFVPALAFDNDGYRLGYGGGYYDKFLKGFCGCKIGIAFGASVTKKLPREEHDQKTDYIITESQVKRTIES